MEHCACRSKVVNCGQKWYYVSIISTSWLQVQILKMPPTSNSGLKLALKTTVWRNTGLLYSAFHLILFSNVSFQWVIIVVLFVLLSSFFPSNTIPSISSSAFVVLSASTTKYILVEHLSLHWHNRGGSCGYFTAGSCFQYRLTVSLRHLTSIAICFKTAITFA